ncbi:MAG TPA: sialidase family protein [Solirubrobacteraceae bacterium]|nr:sialidase family protein [Solirubrobacteraceae bacterium]
MRVCAIGASGLGLVLGFPVCASAATSVTSAPVGCNSSWPVVAHRAGGVTVKLPAGEALPVACAEQTGYATSESTLAIAGDGALIYSPAETENSMARSVNGGASWQLTYPAAEQPTSFWNTVDPDVVADRRTGRVFWSHATGPVRNESSLPDGSGFYLAAAYGFQVYNSADNGLTWNTADYSTAPTGDWEKVFVGPPPPAATGAPQPVGYPDVVYLCANSPVEVSGPGRLCYKSLDGGATFTIAGYASPTASNPPDVCPPLNFNTGVVDSSGTTYQPVDCENSAYVLVSRDEGASYTWIPVPGAPTGTPTSGTNLKLAIDDANNLYAIWTANGLLHMSVSNDHARSWSTPMMVAAPGVTNVDLPAVAAGAPGHVAITYYASTDPSAQMETAYITESEDAAAPQPLFYSGALNDPADPIFHDYGLSDSPRADFVGGSFDSPGTHFWAGVVKQLGPPDASGYIQTTGYVGTLRFSPSTPAAVPTQ